MLRSFLESPAATAVLAALALILVLGVAVVVAKGGPFWPGPTPRWNCGGQIYPNGSCGPIIDVSPKVYVSP